MTGYLSEHCAHGSRADQFVGLFDSKWDQQNTLSLYVLAIVRDPSIRSLRNITPAHLPLLKAIANDGTRAVHARYGVPSEQLRLFVHYQPSYYQFHVHIVSSLFLPSRGIVQRDNDNGCDTHKRLSSSLGPCAACGFSRGCHGSGPSAR